MDQKYKGLKVIHISHDLKGGIGVVIKILCKRFASSICIVADDERESKKSGRFRQITQYMHLQSKLSEHIKDFDILHFHGAWTLHILPLLNIRQIVTIVSPHGAFHKVSLQKSRIKKNIVKYLYMQRAHQNADCIHALTLREAQDIRDYGIKNVPIAIIPNGIDLAKKIHIDEALKKKLLKLADGRKVALSLSRLHVSKGIDILIEAFARLYSESKDVVLFIVGSGESAYELHLKKKINKLKLEESVFLLGEMIEDEKNTVYDIADVFVLPSFNEGFGITVLEAYRQKVPVITTDATPFEEIQVLGCGWYIGSSVDDLFLALLEFSKSDNEELNTMGSKGFAWIQRYYSLDDFESKIETLYHWLAKGGKKPDFIKSDIL
jgi:glycosyltransferase involved in cell wall biosynthesis